MFTSGACDCRIVGCYGLSSRGLSRVWLLVTGSNVGWERRRIASVQGMGRYGDEEGRWTHWKEWTLKGSRVGTFLLSSEARRLCIETPVPGYFSFRLSSMLKGLGFLVMTMIALDEHLPIVGRQVKDGIRSLCTYAYTTKPAAKRRSSKEEKQEEEEERQGSTCCAIAF